jgi:hypothetical protein
MDSLPFQEHLSTKEIHPLGYLCTRLIVLGSPLDEVGWCMLGPMVGIVPHVTMQLDLQVPTLDDLE